MDASNVKALYRRGLANTNMKDFEQAMVCRKPDSMTGTLWAVMQFNSLQTQHNTYKERPWRDNTKALYCCKRYCFCIL